MGKKKKKLPRLFPVFVFSLFPLIFFILSFFFVFEDFRIEKRKMRFLFIFDVIKIHSCLFTYLIHVFNFK